MRLATEPPMHGVDNPLALSLNENPFSPLPAVHDAIVAAVGTANRYPEFLPERLRNVIARHLGVNDEQIVIGAGATGVVMQILHALTDPGDRIVMTYPTFDGYPICARMTRLQTVMVPLDRDGRHSLEAMADAAAEARVVVLCDLTTRAALSSPSPQCAAFYDGCPATRSCCWMRHTSNSYRQASG